MSECFLPELFSQSDSTGIKDTKQLIVEKTFEVQMLEMVNQYRTQNRLQELVLDEDLARIAREHSNEMAMQGFISHDHPSGNVSSRMIHAGYFHDTARENIARSGSIRWAHAALLKSPMHEKNILASDVTNIGIGIIKAPAPCNKMLYITEIFATPRHLPQIEAIHEELLSQINSLRQNGAGTLFSDPLLEQTTLNSLNSLPYPYDRLKLRALLADSVRKLQEGGLTNLSRVDVNVQLVHDPVRLKIADQFGEKTAAVYGSAIRKVLDSSNQPAFLVMTLIGFVNRPIVTRIASR
jgi:hypothetical protein